MRAILASFAVRKEICEIYVIKDERQTEEIEWMEKTFIIPANFIDKTCGVSSESLGLKVKGTEQIVCLLRPTVSPCWERRH